MPSRDDPPQVLVSRLASASWSLRRELVRMLAEQGERAIATLVEALEQQRDDEGRIAALVDALVASGGEVEPPLLARAESATPALLADIAQVLGRRRRTRSVAALVQLTSHADDNVAVAAIEGLGRTGSSSAVEALVACVRSDNFFRVYPAIDVLGRSGDPRAIEPLTSLLGNPRYAFEAARGLARTADRAAVPALLSLLDSASTAAVRVACMALRELSEKHEERYGSAAPIEESLRGACSSARLRRVGQSLGGADRDEKIAICHVLRAWGDAGATPWLLPLLDGDSEVARTASAALRNLGSGTESALAEALREPGSLRRAVLLPAITRASQGEAALECLDDPDSQVRALACEALARIGHASAVPALFARLRDENPRVVHAATAALQALGSDRTLQLASAAAESERLETRRAGLRILAYFGRVEAFPLLAKAALDPDPRVRDVAIQGLALLESSEAVELLLRLSAHPDGRTRAAALRSLGHASARAEALAALRRGLADEDAWVRYYACQALGRQRDQASVAELAAAVHDRAGQVRVAAIEALSAIPSTVASQALRRAASSDDPDVLRAALLGLGLAKDPEARALLTAAAQGREPATRLVALSAIFSLDTASTSEPFERAARDSDDAVRAAAIDYLAKSADSAATAALVQLLLDGVETERVLAALSTPQAARVEGLLAALEQADAEIAQQLVSCLSRLRTEEGRAALFRALGSPSRDARLAAAHGLAALASGDAYRALSQAANDDPDPEVRVVCSLHLAG